MRVFVKALSLLLLLTSQTLYSQESKELFRVRIDEHKKGLKQLLLVNDTLAIGLTKNTTGFKLLNRVILVTDSEIIDEVIGESSVDILYPKGKNSFSAFLPANTQANFIVNHGKIAQLKSETIHFYNYSLLFSTSFVVGVLGLVQDYTIYFNQEQEENQVNRNDSTVTPQYFVYRKGEEHIPINSKIVSEIKYNHWPTYGKAVIPPMIYIRLIGKQIFFPISNLGLIFYFNTKTLEKRTESFPDFEGVNSWSLFYDYIENTPYYVAYMGDNQYNIYHRTDGAYSKVLTMEGFFDSIAAGYALQEKREGDFYVYSKIKLNK